MTGYETGEQERVPQEIERKFIIDDWPQEANGADMSYIQQGYLEINDDGSEVRIRGRNGIYTRTQKFGKGLVRGEIEEGITKSEFMTLWGKTLGHVQKHRFTFDYRG